MFKVTVADNFHYLDCLNFRVVGEYKTWPEAIAAARGVVEGSLANSTSPA